VVSIFLLISTVVESGVAAVGLCAGIVLICSIIVPIVGGIPHKKWIEYAFFEHWQVASHITGGFPLADWTTSGSIAVLAGWSFVCIAMGIGLFQWRDVKS
jgi:ABC-type transport system involved in multi-copper enzyme maturation permease subunit